MSTVGGYHEYTRGYHEYSGGYHEYTGVHHDECGDSMSTVGGGGGGGGYSVHQRDTMSTPET